MKPRLVGRAVLAKLPGIQARSGKEQNHWAVLDGRKVARVTVPKPHGADLKAGTLNSIRKQLHLGPAEFERFVSCTMSSHEYEAHLRTLVKAGEL